MGNIKYGFLVPLIITAVVLVVIAVAVVVIRNKMREVSRSLFGTNSFIDGINQQKEQMSETPRSLHAMTSVYLPMIMRDFPKFDYELYKNKAKSLLRSYFTAIETKKASALTEECSNALKNNVLGIIEDLNSRNVKQHFNESVIHDIEIARYIKTGSTVTIMFQLAVGQYAYAEDASGKVVHGDKDLKTQTVYEVGLVYVQDAELAGEKSGFGLTCPNCGAPIKSLGTKFCEYCGTGVVEVNERTWKFNSVAEQSQGRKQY